jgi:hypothetical protein
MILGPHKYNPPDAVRFSELNPEIKRYGDLYETKLARIIYDKTGIDVFTRRTYRGSEYVKSRYLFLSMMLKFTKKSYKDMAAMFGKDHSTVNHVLKYISNNYETDRKFRELYDSIETKVKNLK